ncbi:sensor histidine kinase [Micromonospora sp. NPDC049559]|uniref:sensor histidine kinase n=1 Tax=Micromonospora sp. NPDC049559 TaxID=3155923 RepID=UPI003431D85D
MIPHTAENRFSNPDAQHFDHPALLYRGIDEYLAGTLPFIRAGLDAGDPVLVAVPGANLAAIRAALGDDASRVRLDDMTVAGRNPGRIIPGVLLAFARAHPGRRPRIIGEPIWPGRSELEYPACAQHEALINAAFAGRNAEILCPYDLADLDQRAIDDAYRTHPTLAMGARRWASPRYGDPLAVAADFNRPLPPPPGHAPTLPVTFDGLSALRHAVARYATTAGLPDDRVEDLVLAVGELAANTVEHAGGTGSVTLWTDEEHLVCQVSDGGHLTDPLAGRIPPAGTAATGGRGLVIVNQLCDLVRVHTRPGATTVRLYLRR